VGGRGRGCPRLTEPAADPVCASPAHGPHPPASDSQAPPPDHPADGIVLTLNLTTQYGCTVIERTLVLVKPDGVQRLLTGRILARYEERGLKLLGLKLVRVSHALAERHYDVHREKPFFGGLVAFITSGPLVAAVLEGPDAIAIVRAMNGATRPHEAAPGSIRGDLAVETAQNLVHGSDSAETAEMEIALWFRPDELIDYERAIDAWVLAPAD